MHLESVMDFVLDFYQDKWTLQCKNMGILMYLVSLFPVAVFIECLDIFVIVVDDLRMGISNMD